MPEELLFDKSLQMIQLMCRIFGINITRDRRSFMQYVILFSNVLMLKVDVMCSFIWVVKGIFIRTSITELTKVAPYVIFGTVCETKVFFLIIYEKKVHVLMNTIRSLEIKAKDFACPERDNSIQPQIIFLNMAVKVLKVLSVLEAVAFCLAPLIIIAVNYFTTGQLERQLQYVSAYPFDATDPRYWPFMYIHQTWTVSCLIATCAADGLCFICCSHIIMQFKLLQHQFQEFIPHRNGSAVDPVDQAAVRATFQKLIIWHQDIISSTNILEDFYSVSILIAFLASSLFICLTGFNVTVTDDKALIVRFFILLFMGMVQAFFLCYYGDNLISSSTDVANAVYNSRWYESDVVMRRNALLVQTRAQIPCKLTAAGFADVNLRAYMRIMSTSWSYFALLQTMYSSRS